MRCTLCGHLRIPRRSDGSPGACSFLGCKEPLHDVDVEQGRKPVPSPPSVLCPICQRPECLGRGSPGARDGERCTGTLLCEAHPQDVSEEMLTEVVEYELEHLHTSGRLPLNPRYTLAMVQEIRRARAPEAHERTTWTEEDGDVLWWKLPVTEAPFVGRLDSDEGIPEYCTHWTRILCPVAPSSSGPSTLRKKCVDTARIADRAPPYAAPIIPQAATMPLRDHEAVKSAVERLTQDLDVARIAIERITRDHRDLIKDLAK